MIKAVDNGLALCELFKMCFLCSVVWNLHKIWLNGSFESRRWCTDMPLIWLYRL